MQEVPYLDLKIQYRALENKIREQTEKVLQGGQYVLGPEVAECEKKLAEFTGAPFCVSAASGTDALLMALLAYDVKAGDEIIVPGFSFFATAEVVALIGAIPVFVDVDPISFNIDPSKIEKAITSKTRGIIPVSLYGQVANMTEINEIAQRHKIVVMEDAAQSFGATYKGDRSCNVSEIACTSFFPAKPLGCFGDGGAVFCQTQEIYDKLLQVRNHGQESRYYHTRLGYNGRLDTLQCAILLVKLERYPWEIEQRQRIAKIYDQEFANLTRMTTPSIEADRDSVYAQYTLKVADRSEFQQKLKDYGVPTSIHYPKGMHQQPIMRELFPEVSLEVTESVCEEVISLPLYADMPEDHVSFVVDQVKKVAK